MENTAIKVALFKKIAGNNQTYSNVVMKTESSELETPSNNPKVKITDQPNQEESIKDE
jgi:hypothetical protein